MVVALAGCSAPNPAYDGGASGVDGADGSPYPTSGGTAAGTTQADASLSASGGVSADVSGDWTPTSSSEGTGGGVAVAFVDAQWRDEFADGERIIEMVWDVDHLRVGDGASKGEFRSRIFDAGAKATWQTIAWRPEGPYGKPLPDDANSETGYGHGNQSHLDLQLLLHFDAVAGTAIADTSGAGHDGMLVDMDGDLSIVGNGVFGPALSNTNSVQPGLAGAYVEVPDAAELAPGTSDFTWSIWFRTENCSANNLVLALDDPANVTGTSTVFLQCHCEATTGFAYGLRFDGLGPMGCVTGSLLADAQWHHLALVKDGTANLARAFHNGVEVTVDPGTPPMNLPAAGNETFTIGGSADLEYPGQGDYDELAVWARALDPQEILELWHRGVSGLELQVRTCEMADCSDGTFVGPDGTPQTVFRERPNAAVGEQYPLSPAFFGRYVQYQVTAHGPPGPWRRPGLHRFEMLGQRD